jgi:ubiquinone/menaquinone biosynthesis C-methylase UbiE
MADSEFDERSWPDRQRLMEAWYQEMLTDDMAASAAFRSDLDRFAGKLGQLSGRILDVGGGNGMVRCYLAEPVDYVSVDPSMSWLGPDWTKLSGEWPCLATPLCFVVGLGESLPFIGESFDVTLALWSLNHARRPDVFMTELRRVLRPGGRCLLVLEDMQPRWRDIISMAGTSSTRRGFPRYAKHKALTSMGIRQPEVQPDHLRISERELKRWCKGFELRERSWAGSYLSIDLLKRG